ncbi:MAG: SAF domain-containing protein [Propionibacteriaceae bacterium]|nr:SAF domain-containing protein [Propionibacteriaceae bacterium]
MKPNPLTRLARFLTAHRRLAASTAAMVSVFALAAIAAGQDEHRVTVVAVAAPLAAGHLLAASELTTVAVPADVVPDGALTAADEAVGRMLAANRPRGAIVTSDDLVAESGHTAGPGRLVLPVYLAQTDILKLVRPGDRIALLVSDGPAGQTTIAEDVLVVAVPEVETSGFMSSGSAEYVLVDVPHDTAALLARASATSTVTAALM